MRRTHVPVLVPGPRAHLEGTRRLLAQFSALADVPPDPGLVALLGDPEALPAEVPPEDRTLKYDAYLSPGPRGVAWGVAIGDRWEADAFRARAEAWIAARPEGYALDAARRLGAALAGAAPSLTLAVGFDRPDHPPRVKVYLQEERWQAGVATAGELRALLPTLAPGCELPAWIPGDRPVGVVTVELLPGGRLGVKLYLGGPIARDAAAGAPERARALAETLDEASPAPGGWAYLTVRLRPGEAARYSANKIYDHVAGFRDGAGWADVAGLFARAGRADTMARLWAAVGALDGVRVVPTASALDEDGAADVYCAAWAHRG